MKAELLTRSSLLLMIVLVGLGCTPDRLERVSYVSEVDSLERDYYVYLPVNYDTYPGKKWPVIMFLHGNGERGNGKDELDFVLKHGPLFEAWTQRKELPFIMIVPQLQMFGLDTVGIDYLTDRDITKVPKRLDIGTPPREPDYPGPPMHGEAAVTEFTGSLPLSQYGWDRVQHDLIGMLDYVDEHYQTDGRVFLTGLSYGGFGTWFMASHYPDRFTAISPVVGWGHPSLMGPIAKHKIPVWAFAGGKDTSVEKKYFYHGLNLLESMGHKQVRFTVHEDMAHDTWKRVYAGDDLYNWFLSINKAEN